MSVRFRALESVLPSQQLTNDMIVDRIVAENKEVLSAAELALLVRRMRALFELCRSDTRYCRASDETPLSLGTAAGRAALCSAKMDPSEIGLLMHVGVARAYVEPATANVYQSELGLVNATCFDLLDACASWVRALHIARTFILAGTYQHVMILNTECSLREFGNCRFSSVDELRYRFPSFSIGEAATATIVSAAAGEDDRFYATFRNSGRHEHLLCRISLPRHNEYEQTTDTCIPPLEFRSDGESLFRATVNLLQAHYRSDPEINTFPADIAFSHAASDSLSERVTRELAIRARSYLTHSRFGNTSSASIPLAMAAARSEGALRPNMNVLLGCGSSGIVSAWLRFRYLV